jgi:hypothetical protein
VVVVRVDAAPNEVSSLSAGQVESLLRTLEIHRDLLQVGHEDARRLAHQGLRPAYLLDFELIFRFVFKPEDRPEWTGEFQYLLEHERTHFLIGPGTRLEIEQFMYSAGYVIDADGAPQELAPGIGSQEVYGLDAETVEVGVYRLCRLLNEPNVRSYDDLVDHGDFDAESKQAYDTSKAALDMRRRGRIGANANRSDALNWAAVLYLRRHAEELQTGLHPYLLTATKPLLDERTWSADISYPVSRRPSGAIYTETLLDLFDDPIEAANHTLEMAFNAAALDRDLRLTPAYIYPDDYRDEPRWEKVVEDNLATDKLKRQLDALAEFVSDPVINDTQRIYDNARLAAASSVAQRGPVLRAIDESPRKLFDLIVELSAALGAGGGRAVADLWQTVLELTPVELPQRVSYQLTERGAGSRRTRYLVADHYTPSTHDHSGDAAAPGHYVLRWDSSLDADAVFSSFSRAFERHGVSEVELAVGTDDDIQEFGAEIPIALDDLIGFFHSPDPDSDGSREPPPIRWIRMSADPFDLYADIPSDDFARAPIVGVFVDDINASHLEDLYLRTCARYVLPVWLRSALNAIAAARPMPVESAGDDESLPI